MKHEVRQILAKMGILVEFDLDNLVERIYSEADLPCLELEWKPQMHSTSELLQKCFMLDAETRCFIPMILDHINEDCPGLIQEFIKKSSEEYISKPNLKVMGTGSRSMLTHPDAREIYLNLEEEILRLNDKYNLHIISGMAEGWDEAIAKVAMRNNIPYTVMIPNDTYGGYYWGQHSLLKKNRLTTFNELVSHATKVVYVCDSIYEEINGKKVHANFIRNQAMVDACDMALVYKPGSRGTRDAVQRLKKADKHYEVAPFKQ